MLKNILPIIKKEFRQIKRDRRILGILIFLPCFMLVMFGYAVNFDVTNLSLAIYDMDKSQQSRDLVKSFTNSGYFTLVRDLSSFKGVDDVIGNEIAKVAVIIPRGFSKDILKGNTTTMQIVIDGSNSTTASTAIGYISSAVQDYSGKILVNTLSKIGRENFVPINYRPRIWFNPELKSAKFLVPGLMGMILMISCVVTTALSLVREKEKGTIEQIIVSPVRPFELIIGKTIPYAIIALVSASFILIAGYLLFGVSVKGSFLLLFITTSIFIICGLGMGLVISSITDSQQVAFQISALSSLLPSMLLSGFVFPIKSMPLVLQIITNLTPVKFYLVSLRSIILKGVGIVAFWDQLVYMMIFASVVLTISSVKMKTYKL